MSSVREDFAELGRVLEATEALAPQIEAVARLVVETLGRGGKLLFCGNGGSAADAQHLAAEYVVRFVRERRALPAIALTVDASILTAGGNDFGFEEVFARQIESLGDEGDLLFLHSTSGNSPNLIRAVEKATELGITTVGMLAKGGGRMAQQVDHAIVVPTDVTARAQEMHIAIGHMICEHTDRWANGETQ